MKDPDTKNCVFYMALWREFVIDEHFERGDGHTEGGHTIRSKCTKSCLQSREVFVLEVRGKLRSSILWLYTIYPNVKTVSQAPNLQ